jgi:hypothetical protein
MPTPLGAGRLDPLEATFDGSQVGRHGRTNGIVVHTVRRRQEHQSDVFGDAPADLRERGGIRLYLFQGAGDGPDTHPHRAVDGARSTSASRCARSGASRSVSFSI